MWQAKETNSYYIIKLVLENAQKDSVRGASKKGSSIIPRVQRHISTEIDVQFVHTAVKPVYDSSSRGLAHTFTVRKKLPLVKNIVVFGELLKSRRPFK